MAVLSDPIARLSGQRGFPVLHRRPADASGEQRTRLSFARHNLQKPNEICCRDIGSGTEIAFYTSVRANHLNRIETQNNGVVVAPPTPDT